MQLLDLIQCQYSIFSLKCLSEIMQPIFCCALYNRTYAQSTGLQAHRIERGSTRPFNCLPQALISASCLCLPPLSATANDYGTPTLPTPVKDNEHRKTEVFTLNKKISKYIIALSVLLIYCQLLSR